MYVLVLMVLSSTKVTAELGM